MAVSTKWFQEAVQGAALSKSVKDAVIQQYHIKINEESGIHTASYGNVNRTEKLSSAVRDSVERNGSAQLTALARNAVEDRTAILKVKSDEARQEAANFVNVLLSAKDTRISQAKEVNDQKILGLKTALDFEIDVYDGESQKTRAATNNLGLRIARENSTLENQHSLNQGDNVEKLESGVRRMELEQLAGQFSAEKDNTFLALQTERTQADTNRRLALDRAANDSRVEAVTAAATLQEAEAKTKVLLFEILNSAAIARNAFETKQLLKTTTVQTEQAAAVSATTASRDALAAARAEAAILRSRPRRE